MQCCPADLAARARLSFCAHALAGTSWRPLAQALPKSLGVLGVFSVSGSCTNENFQALNQVVTVKNSQDALSALAAAGKRQVSGGPSPAAQPSAFVPTTTVSMQRAACAFRREGRHILTAA